MVDSQTEVGSIREFLEESKPLVDEYGRRINYLRLSLTQRCNHSCFFCHREGEADSGAEMTGEEIARLVRLVSKLGITRVKLTGGEPLLREDIIDIVKSLSPMVEDLSLTTNGSLLEEKAFDLKKAGLNRINVSLHTLNNETHGKVTGSNDLDIVKRGIEKSIEVGLTPIKINMTMLRGLNEQEITSMINFAGEIGATLQLIELQEIADIPGTQSNFWVDLDPIEEYLRKVAVKVEQRALHGRRIYTVLTNDGKITIEVVRPMHNPSFCGQCTRLRVTSDGKLKPCLLRNDNLVSTRLDRDETDSEGNLLTALMKAVKIREPFWKEEGQA